MRKKVIVVLGMHRSGTSMITRSLQVLGVDLGNTLLEAIPGVNDKGFWEDLDILKFNEEVLSFIGLEWNSLTPINSHHIELLKSKGYLLKAVELLRHKIESCSVFGFKDPRVSRLLPLWIEVFSHCDVDADFIFAIRNPLSVVRSLHVRDGMDAKRAYYLWLTHVLTILAYLPSKELPIVDYDFFIADPESNIRRISAALGFEINQSEMQQYLESFFSRDLRHSLFSIDDLLLDQDCPRLVHTIYKELLSSASSDRVAPSLEDIGMDGYEWGDSGSRISDVLFAFSLIDELYGRNLSSEMESKKLLEKISHSSELIKFREELIGRANDVIEERDREILFLKGRLSHQDDLICGLRENVSLRESELNDKKALLAELESRIQLQLQEIDGQRRMVEDLQGACYHKDQAMKLMVDSKSWKITKPLRYFGRVLRGDLSTVSRTNLLKLSVLRTRIKNAFGYLLRGDFGGLWARFKFYQMERLEAGRISGFVDASTCLSLRWGVISPPHTLFLAEMIADRLRHHGWKVDVLVGEQASYPNDFYFVLGAQVFAKLPSPEKMIIYQLEQSVSSRWFTDKYLKLLNNSLAVVDYALHNIEYLSGKRIAYPHVHYLPIGARLGLLSNENKIYDLIFYGDSLSSPRRRRLLDALKGRYNILVVNDVFGEEVHSLISKSKAVLNIHYYDGALLEMPRIQECLSLGVPVISESARDQDDYPEIFGAVYFFQEGSIPDMLNAVERVLDDSEREISISNAVERGASRFNYMFDRFLVAMNFLSVEHVSCMTPPLLDDGDLYGLSLPETVERRKLFVKNKPEKCVIFDGIRRSPGWIGCGLSYQLLLKHSLDNGLPHVAVMEDDVLLPDDFDHKYGLVMRYLETKAGAWDVFAGVIASVHPECKIKKVEIFEGVTFVTINKMVSMVFNIYSRRFMRVIQAWDPLDQDSENNTVDRFVESQEDLNVVIMLPFMVGHREDVNSSLWGFKNSQYADMIRSSEAVFFEKISEFDSV